MKKSKYRKENKFIGRKRHQFYFFLFFYHFKKNIENREKKKEIILSLSVQKSELNFKKYKNQN
jgi:hypothetical protein